jgi:DNA modification methylase
MPRVLRKPYWKTYDRSVSLWHGNVEDVLRGLPTGSVQCCVTSPPYWSLRDYGSDRDHMIGLEPTPQQYVERMVGVFRELRRVLRDDGCLFVNLGDTYAGSSKGGAVSNEAVARLRGKDPTIPVQDGGRWQYVPQLAPGQCKVPPGLKPGDMCGIPWRVAFALQDDGWVLRSDMPWVKRNPLPESVTSRPGKALEYVFMLTKSMGYYYDHMAVRRESPEYVQTRIEKEKSAGMNGRLAHKHADEYGLARGDSTLADQVGAREPGRNFRNADLWFESISAPHGMVQVEDEVVGLDVTTKGYRGAHFATFPTKLIEPLIKAATSEKGACPECGGPWRRVVVTTGEWRADHDRLAKHNGEVYPSNPGGGIAGKNTSRVSTEVGWEPSCKCQGVGEEDLLPCTVLDPFIGSGTTAVVCLGLRLHCWGIDLKEEYLKANAIPRISGEMRGRGLGREVP